MKNLDDQSLSSAVRMHPGRHSQRLSPTTRQSTRKTLVNTRTPQDGSLRTNEPRPSPGLSYAFRSVMSVVLPVALYLCTIVMVAVHTLPSRGRDLGATWRSEAPGPRGVPAGVGPFRERPRSGGLNSNYRSIPRPALVRSEGTSPGEFGYNGFGTLTTAWGRLVSTGYV